MTLSPLKQDAYVAYCAEIKGSPETYEQWSNIRTGNTPMYQYWTKFIELKLLICRFVGSLCEGDFDLYIQVLDELCP